MQDRSLRITLNDYQFDYKTLLESSGQELTYISRRKGLVYFVYKAFDNTGPDLTNGVFNKKDIYHNLEDNPIP